MNNTIIIDTITTDVARPAASGGLCATDPLQNTPMDYLAKIARHNDISLRLGKYDYLYKLQDTPGGVADYLSKIASSEGGPQTET